MACPPASSRLLFATTLTILDQNRHPLTDRIASYGEAIDRAREAHEAHRLTVRIPRLVGFRERRPGLPFHATPELFFQQSGSTRFTTPGETFHLRAGEVCLMPRGMPHAETTSQPVKDYRTMITMFHHLSFSLHYGHASSQRTVLSQPLDHFGALAHAQVIRYLDDIVAATAGETSMKHPLIRGLLLATFSLLAREVRRPAVVEVAPHPPLIARCLDLIEANLSEARLSVQWLAGHLGCSADHLSRAFRRETKHNLIEAIHDRRLALAQRLLDEQTLNVGEVAWASGFATQSYFNRVFRNRLGLTPKQYRASAIAKGRIIG